MRKILVVLLVVGLLVGAIGAAVATEDGASAYSFHGWEGYDSSDPGATPCGGGHGDGGAPD
jgi:hypothetical protein